MRVCKFGGSCLTSATAIKNIKKLKKMSNGRKIFVFSAIGKENLKDEKITDLLIDYTNAPHKATQDEIIEKIIKKYEKLAKITKINVNIQEKINKYKNNYLKNHDKNYFISRGEYLTAFIMAKYLKIKFIPAEKVLYFKGKKIDEKLSTKKIKYYLKKYKKIVIPGFYGINLNKKIVLLSRGGGDVSGAIFAKLSNAKIYENWTDVAGIYQVNPTYLKSQTIQKLSYDDLAFMTQMDTKVIHQDCATILKGLHVTLQVGSAMDLSLKKTKVSDDYQNSLPFICTKKDLQKVQIFVCQNFQKFQIVDVDEIDVKDKIKTLYQNLQKVSP